MHVSNICLGGTISQIFHFILKNRKLFVIIYNLRIDNSWQGVFCIVVIFSVPMHFIFTHYISNEREFISLSNNTNNYIIKVSPEK